MSNLHRIIWIDACIREGRYPNGRIIAGQFEISLRQAQRDIEYLRYSMGAPVEYSTSKNGYYYADEAFALPAVYLSGSDRNILSYLAGQYSMTGGERASQLASLFTRLSGENDEYTADSQSLPFFDIDRTEPSVFNQLAKACASRFKVRIDYRNSSGENIISHVNSNYASGRKAYGNLIGSLEKKDFDVFGLPYLLAVYADSKKNAAQYLTFLAESQPDLKGLDKAAKLFSQIAGKFEELTRIFPFTGSNGMDGTADRSKAQEALKLVRECFELEEQGIINIKSIIG